mmetsp:Transcript_43481/g.85121  ORF Transcript_43481/g.85121 Transcript_43481/m.85121 type:complete len:297 (-) Transcript_43481:132-1022(-)
MFEPAGQPDMVRALQKDQYCISTLKDDVDNLAANVLGSKASAYEDEISLLSTAAYHVLTTGTGNQTLGEEYCDILQVHNHMSPTPSRRWSLISMEVLLPYVFLKLKNYNPVPVRQSANFLNRLRAMLWNSVLRLTKAVAPILARCQRYHLALFYLFGVYLQWTKRVAGIKYVFLRKLRIPRPGYQMLGLLLLIQLIGEAILDIRNSIREMQENSQHAGIEIVRDADSLDHEEDENSQCMICMCPRDNATATDCGHLFCWNCIAECVTNKAECPYCRQPQVLSNLLRLTGYTKATSD